MTMPRSSLDRSRSVERIVRGAPLLPAALQRRLDPFLALEAWRGSSPASLALAGLDAITWVFEGSLQHRDSAGHQALLQAGDVQWLQAGRGLRVQQEASTQSLEASGVRLWLNRAQADKSNAPQQRVWTPNELPWQQSPGIDGPEWRSLSLSLGLPDAASASEQGLDPGALLQELRWPSAGGAAWDVALPCDHHAWLLVLSGEVAVGDAEVAPPVRVSEGRLAVLTNDIHAPRVRLQGLPSLQSAGQAQATPCWVLIGAARALEEPIVQQGGLVHTTPAAVQAQMDALHAAVD